MRDEEMAEESEKSLKEISEIFDAEYILEVNIGNWNEIYR